MQFDTMRVSRAPNPPRDAVVDRAVIAELGETLGEEVVKELIETFLQDVPKQVAAIEAAGSAPVLSRAAHRLKGGSMSLGLLEVTELCVRLEDAARSGQMDRISAEIAAVRGAVARAVAVLSTLPR